MGEVIAITSGKGGAGKTVATANIGVGLAALGKQVVVVDLNLGLRNLDIVFGQENHILNHLVDVIKERCLLDEALQKDALYDSLFLLPAAQTKAQSDVTEEELHALISTLKNRFDYVLLDCPSGVEEGFQHAIACADRAIVLTSTETAAVRNTDCIIHRLRQQRIPTIQLLFNRVRFDLIKQGEVMSIEEVTELLSPPVIGILQETDEILIHSNKGETLIGQSCEAGQRFQTICKRILGEEIALTYPKDDKKGFFSRFSKMFQTKNN